MNSFIKTLLIAVGLVLIFASPAIVSAQFEAPLTEVCTGNGASSSVCVDRASQANSGDNPVAVLLGNIARIVALAIGVVSVIFIIFGGFNYVTSGGDSNKAAKARTTIIWALIGLAVGSLAYTITLFIVDKFVASILL